MNEQKVEEIRKRKQEINALDDEQENQALLLDTELAQCCIEDLRAIEEMMEAFLHQHRGQRGDRQNMLDALDLITKTRRSEENEQYHRAQA